MTASDACSWLTGVLWCAFWAFFFFFTAVAKSAYASYYRLPVWSFWPADPVLTGHFFLFSTAFCINSRDCCGWKSQELSGFWNTQTSPSHTDDHALKSQRSPRPLFWCLMRTLTEALDWLIKTVWISRCTGFPIKVNGERICLLQLGLKRTFITISKTGTIPVFAFWIFRWCRRRPVLLVRGLDTCRR